MKLVLTKPWPGPNRTMQPGEYAIPRDISLSLAKCARNDGAGNIEADAAVEVVPTLAPFLPEIKEQHAIPPATIHPPGSTRSSKRGKGSPAR